MAFIMSIIPSIQMNSGILGELGVILIFGKIFSAVEHSLTPSLRVYLSFSLTLIEWGRGGEGMNHELQRFNQIIMNFSIQSLGIMNHEIQFKTNHEYQIKGCT